MAEEAVYPYSSEQLEQIEKLTTDALNAAHEALNDRTKDFADREIYENLTEFAYEQVLTYIDNPETLKKILTDSGMFQTMYHEIESKERFDEMTSDELRHLPHVFMMQIIAGACGFAVREAIEVLGDEEAQKAGLYALEDQYARFGKDAMEYANGKNKNVGIQHVGE